jgi:hypothetical protein
LCSRRKLFLQTAPFVPFWWEPQLKILNFMRLNRSRVFLQPLAHALLWQAIVCATAGSRDEQKRLWLMNEFLLLALVVIYLTISYPPKSKQPNSTGGERSRRFFAFIGKKRA